MTRSRIRAAVSGRLAVVLVALVLSACDRPREPRNDVSLTCPGDLSTISCAGLLLFAATNR